MGITIKQILQPQVCLLKKSANLLDIPFCTNGSIKLKKLKNLQTGGSLTAICINAYITIGRPLFKTLTQNAVATMLH